MDCTIIPRFPEEFSLLGPAGSWSWALRTALPRPGVIGRERRSWTCLWRPLSRSLARVYGIWLPTERGSTRTASARRPVKGSALSRPRAPRLRPVRSTSTASDHL